MSNETIFTKENTVTEMRKDGVTGDYVYNLYVIKESGLKVCHSTFKTFRESENKRTELIKGDSK